MIQRARPQPVNAQRGSWSSLLPAALIVLAIGSCFTSGDSRGAESFAPNGQTVLTVPSGVDIGVKLDYLSRQSLKRIGREPLERAYRKLIRQHRADPRTAEAMMRIGHMYHAAEIPELDIHPDTEKAMEWFRMAAQTAKEGSPTWVDAQMMIAGCHLTNAEEARNRLRSLSDRASLRLAEVEYNLQAIAIREGNLDQAEKHCRCLLSWYTDRSRIPKDKLIKHQVDSLITSSGSFMVHQIRVAHGLPATQRRTRIQKLMNDFVVLQDLQRDGAEELAALGTE